MTADTAPKSALDGLVSCGRCGTAMSFWEPTSHEEALYRCAGNHCDNEVQAHTTDRLVIANVLDAILTSTAQETVAATIKELNAEYQTGGTFPIEDIALLKEEPNLFLRAVKGPVRARGFLSMFIDRIALLPGTAVVQYALPLPPDSHLAGAKQQKILAIPNFGTVDADDFDINSALRGYS